MALSFTHKPRVFMGHNRYLIRGGEDESTDAEIRLLREHGHDVVFYEENNQRISGLPSWSVAASTLWSKESYRRILSVLRDGDYGVAHFQNTFPLISPAAYYAARKTGVPVVQSLRNYRLLCPNAQFLRNGKICEDCLGAKPLPWPAVKHACYRDSAQGSAVVASMLALHRLLGTWKKQVDLFVALSEFQRDKFIAAGFARDRVVVKPNFVHPDPGTGTHNGGFALYVGRLSEEKGIRTMMAAWDELGPSVSLRIVGTGPLMAEVQHWAEGRQHVEILGARPISEVYTLMQEAKLLVFSPVWYEPFGRVVVEAFATGLPVVVSNVGAMAELVEEGRTGFHSVSGDAASLAGKVAWGWNHTAELRDMGRACRSEFEAKYTAEANYRRLMEIYRMATHFAGERS